MAAAGRAGDLDAFHTQGIIFMPGNGTWDGIEERRPTAATIELGGTLVEWSGATSARVDTGFRVLIILPSTSAFSSLLTENSKLFGREDGSPFRLGFVLGRHRSYLQGWVQIAGLSGDQSFSLD